jgi:hypothetical protein
VFDLGPTRRRKVYIGFSMVRAWRIRLQTMVLMGQIFEDPDLRVL